MSENGIKRVHIAVCQSHLLCLEQQIWVTLFATTLHRTYLYSWLFFPATVFFLCAVFPSLGSAVVVTVSEKPKGTFSLSFCSSDWSPLFPVGLKTYLISGQKVKEPHCSCSQALLPGLESSDGARTPGTSSAENSSDPTKTTKQVEKPKVSCPLKAQEHSSQSRDGETLWACLCTAFHIYICMNVYTYSDKTEFEGGKIYQVKCLIVH